MTSFMSPNTGLMNSTGHTLDNPLVNRDPSAVKPGTRTWRVSGLTGHRINFAAINRAALVVLPALLARWLPDGRAEGHEFVSRNPRRADRNAGSFKVNLRTGRWADFATGDRGGDPVSLAAYLFGLRQAEAACRLANMLGLPSGETPR